MKNILFITSLKNPSQIMSSTDIMTRNILTGLCQNKYNVTLLALYDKEDEIPAIAQEYSKYVNKILFLPRFFNETQNKYFFLFYSFIKQIFCGFYKKQVMTIRNDIISPEVIVSNKITLDEILYGKIIKSIFPGAKLYQYWSDPMTLSGITKRLLTKTPRRWLFWIVEKMAISKSDAIIYGTKTLLDTQKKLFKSSKEMMTYIDICYTPDDNRENFCSLNVNRVLYAGNYYSSTRNILPLAEAISRHNSLHLDVYGSGDVDLSKYTNVHVYGRVSSEEIKQIEKSYDLTICILNHTATQIPGKIFYEMASPKKILVLSDGPYQNEIAEYLDKYKRFIVCKNEVDAILSCLNLEKLALDVDFAFVKEHYSPKTVARSLIDGGLNDESL